jgi:hypothetical protein
MQRVRAALPTRIRGVSVLRLGLIALIAAASWPVADGPARTGLDPSFAAALGYAITHGERFGSDILYTYGPLGFLGFGSPWYGPLTLLSLVFIGSVHMGLCAVIVLGALRVLPALAAVPVAYLAARELRAFLAFEGLLILVTCTAMLFLLGGSDRGRRLAAPLGGLAIAIGLLGKLNAGVFISAIVVVAIVARSRPWWRGGLLLAAWSAAWLIPLWLLSGHGASELPGYVQGSYELISGFSQAMGLDPGPEGGWYAIAYFIGVLIVGAVAVRASVGIATSRRIALVLVGGFAAFAFYKTGFVRWHIGYAMALPVVVLFAAARRRTTPRLFVAAWLAVLVPAVAVWGDPIAFANPITSLRSLWHQAQVVAEPWTWDAVAERSRSQLRAAYALEPEVLAALRGQTVHVDPWETGVIVAWPELTWQPLPVFQSYTAYTPWLDERNAAVLRSAAAPTRILRGGPRLGGVPETPAGATLDGRYRWFESPAAMLETFCRYEEVAATGRWEVLALGARHCGEPELLGTVTAATGVTVAVPVEERPDRLVIVRVGGIEAGIVDRIVTTLFKSPEWRVTLNAERGYRLVPGTAADGLLLSVPASIRRSPGFDFEEPVRDLAIAPAGQRDRPSSLTYAFYSVPLLAG